MEGRGKEEGEGAGQAGMQDKLARLSAMLTVRARASLLCHRTQRESHKAQSLSKKTVFHRSHVFIQQGTHASGDSSTASIL